MGVVEQATQRSLAAQARRKKWKTRDNIFYKSKSGKITNMSDYSASQFHSAYTKIFSGKSGSSSSRIRSISRSSNSASRRLDQILKHGANNAMAQYQHAMVDSRVSLAGLNKNQLLQILSQTLKRQK